jgi:hypothetical protein
MRMSQIERESFTEVLEAADHLDITIIDKYGWGLFGEHCIAITGPVEHLFPFLLYLGNHLRTEDAILIGQSTRTVMSGGGYVLYWPEWLFASEETGTA